MEYIQEAKVRLELVGDELPGGRLGRGWLECRVGWLEAARQLSNVWATAPLRPPPSAKPSVSGLIGQVTNAAQGLRLAAAAWESFRRSAFDADAASLAQLRLAALQPALLYDGLLAALGGNQTGLELPPASELAGRHLERAVLSWAQAQLAGLERTAGDDAQLLDGLRLVMSVLHRLLRAPVCIPGFFFLLPQHTTVQVDMRGGGEDVRSESGVSGTWGEMAVPAGRDAVVSVEGVVSQRLPANRKHPLRKPSQLQLSFGQNFPPASGMEGHKTEKPAGPLKRRVKIEVHQAFDLPSERREEGHNQGDVFTHSAVLGVGGSGSVELELSLVAEETTWTLFLPTKPTLNINLLPDPTLLT